MKKRTNPYIGINSNIMENGVPIGQFGDKEVAWHTDHSYREIPLSYSVLYGTLAPEHGGETGFCNMYLALETLPAATRARIKDLSIKNNPAYNSAGQLRGNQQAPEDIRTAPGPSHPIVCTHPKTGHNALYLGRRPHAYINGLSVEESEALLDVLWAHATKPEFQWHHKWRKGDILMWDNRAVMHHRNAIPPGQDRIAKRCQLDGEPTLTDPAAFAKPPHPRGYLNA
ncbi:MAG: TauD/TfdA family dioxygenase [Rhodospirillales bacterium]